MDFIPGANVFKADDPQNTFFAHRNCEALRWIITLVPAHGDSSYAIFEDNMESMEEYVQLHIFLEE